MIQGESKKRFNLHFQHHQDFLEDKKFCNINYSHSAISEQVLKLFGQCQNCQNLIFEWPYQLYKTIFEKYFLVKMFTVMFLNMY